MTSKQNVAMATGHLVATADQAERLAVLLTSMQQIVRARINPVGLIGSQMAETIEELAVAIVADIRAAVKAAAGRTEDE